MEKQMRSSRSDSKGNECSYNCSRLDCVKITRYFIQPVPDAIPRDDVQAKEKCVNMGYQ